MKNNPSRISCEIAGCPTPAVSGVFLGTQRYCIAECTDHAAPAPPPLVRWNLCGVHMKGVKDNFQMVDPGINYSNVGVFILPAPQKMGRPGLT